MKRYLERRVRGNQNEDVQLLTVVREDAVVQGNQEHEGGGWTGSKVYKVRVLRVKIKRY